MSRALVVFDGDNIERSLANELEMQLSYPKLMRILPELADASSIKAVAFFTLPKTQTALDRQQRKFEVLQAVGIQIRRFRRVYSRKSKRYLGYQDEVIMRLVRRELQADSFDTLVLVTADRDFVKVAVEVQSQGGRVIALTPQPVWWPPPIVVHELDELDCQHRGLLLSV